MLIILSTPVGDSLVLDQVYRACIVTFSWSETRVYFLILYKVDFDVILGMDWLAPYQEVLDFYAKTVTLSRPDLQVMMASTKYH